MTGAPAICFAKLPLRFDADRLAAEAESLPADAWTRHFNQRDFEGDWSGVPLRSVGGAAQGLYPASMQAEDYRDTAVLAGLPYAKEVLGSFQAPVHSARFLRLKAGSSILEHRDPGVRYEDGFARLHVPVVTHPGVRFRLDGRVAPMAAGECWYLDFNRPHSVENTSPIDRLHLVFDLSANAWLDQLFARSEPVRDAVGDEISLA